MIEALIKLKIPTLVLIGVIFWFGSDLIAKPTTTFISPSCIAGSILLVFGVFMAILAFVDYRYKEQTDGAIEQMGNALLALGKATRNYASTNSAVNKALQDTLKGGAETIGKERRKYRLESPGETSTIEPED